MLLLSRNIDVFLDIFLSFRLSNHRKTNSIFVTTSYFSYGYKTKLNFHGLISLLLKECS